MMMMVVVVVLMVYDERHKRYEICTLYRLTQISSKYEMKKKRQTIKNERDQEDAK